MITFSRKIIFARVARPIIGKRRGTTTTAWTISAQFELISQENENFILCSSHNYLILKILKKSLNNRQRVTILANYAKKKKIFSPTPGAFTFDNNFLVPCNRFIAAIIILWEKGVSFELFFEQISMNSEIFILRATVFEKFSINHH